MTSRRTDADPLTAANQAFREQLHRPAPTSSSSSSTGSGSTSINLPSLRTRSVVVDHSLASQWRGTAGRTHQSGAYVSDSQRVWLFVTLFLIAALLIIGTLHFSEPSSIHPKAVLPADHPHMLKRAAAMAQAQAAAALNAVGGSVGASPLASPYSVLYVTVPSADVAQKLASGLLSNKLVACANIVPGVTSMYWWEGAIQTDQEQLMMLKTRSALFEEVRAFVQANHPYQTPEVIELPIQQGHQSYLDWIKTSTRDPSQQ